MLRPMHTVVPVIGEVMDVKAETDTLNEDGWVNHKSKVLLAPAEVESDLDISQAAAVRIRVDWLERGRVRAGRS